MLTRGQLEQIVALRRQLHRHPELAMQEEKTKTILKEFLQSQTPHTVCDEGSWLYVKVPGRLPGPATAFRADFDALPIEEGIELPWASLHPGRSHKCGHDGHAAALAGFSLYLAQEQPLHDVILLFQPGEETGEGAKECLGLFEKEEIRRIYAWHNEPGTPEGTLSIRPGLMYCASKGLSLYFTGKKSHASQPEEGINPSKAISRLVLALEEIRDQLTQDPLTFSTVVEIRAGEEAFGTAAGEGVLRLTLRSETEANMQLLEKRILEQAKALAEEERLRLHWETSDEFPETANDPGAAQAMIRAARRLGMTVHIPESPEAGSEDFGWLSKAVPGAIAGIGCGEEYPPLHTIRYDFPDKLIPAALRLLRELLREEEDHEKTLL